MKSNNKIKRGLIIFGVIAFLFLEFFLAYLLPYEILNQKENLKTTIQTEQEVYHLTVLYQMNEKEKLLFSVFIILSFLLIYTATYGIYQEETKWVDKI